MHILELSKIAQRHWSTEVWKTNSVIILQRIQVGGGVSVGGIVSVVVPACCRRCFTLHHPDWKHIQYRSIQIVEGFFWNVTHLHMNGWEHTHTSPSDLMLVSLGDLLSCQAAEAVVSTTPGEAWQLLKHSVCVCGGFSSRIFFSSVCFVSAKQILWELHKTTSNQDISFISEWNWKLSGVARGFGGIRKCFYSLQLGFISKFIHYLFPNFFLKTLTLRKLL